MGIRHLILWLAVAAALSGIALHGYISLFKADGGPNPFTLGLWAWSAFPYAICLFVALARKRPLLVLFGAVAALAVDLISYHSVFVAPTSSTAAVGLLFAPLINLLACVPLGMLAGRALEWWGNRRTAS